MEDRATAPHAYRVILSILVVNFERGIVRLTLHDTEGVNAEVLKPLRERHARTVQIRSEHVIFSREAVVSNKVNVSHLHRNLCIDPRQE